VATRAETIIDFWATIEMGQVEKLQGIMDPAMQKATRAYIKELAKINNLSENVPFNNKRLQAILKKASDVFDVIWFESIPEMRAFLSVQYGIAEDEAKEMLFLVDAPDERLSGGVEEVPA